MEDLVLPQVNKYLLSLDQSSTNTGWALFKNEKLIDLGAFKANGQEDERIEDMRKWLEKKINEIILDENAILRLVFEDIQLQRNDVRTYKVLAHLQGVLINVFFRNKEKIKGGLNIYYSAEWKSTCGILGRDRPTQKLNAQAYVLNVFGLEVSQDICDAICLGVHDLAQDRDKIEFKNE